MAVADVCRAPECTGFLISSKKASKTFPLCTLPLFMYQQYRNVLEQWPLQKPLPGIQFFTGYIYLFFSCQNRVCIVTHWLTESVAEPLLILEQVRTSLFLPWRCALCSRLGLSVIGFRLVDLFSEKKYCGSPWVPDPPSLAQMTFTLCTSMSELKFVAKFSNMCHFRHFLRVPRNTWPKSTGLPGKI